MRVKRSDVQIEQPTQPGKPAENGLIKSFNGRLRDECLKANWFSNLEEASRLIEEWRQDYNVSRPHSSLGNLAPVEYAAKLLAEMPFPQ